MSPADRMITIDHTSTLRAPTVRVQRWTACHTAGCCPRRQPKELPWQQRNTRRRPNSTRMPLIRISRRRTATPKATQQRVLNTPRSRSSIRNLPPSKPTRPPRRVNSRSSHERPGESRASFLAANREQVGGRARRNVVGLIVFLIILVLLFGGGGFYFGSPYHYYGGGVSLLVVIIILFLLFR